MKYTYILIFFFVIIQSCKSQDKQENTIKLLPQPFEYTINSEIVDRIIYNVLNKLKNIIMDIDNRESLFKTLTKENQRKLVDSIVLRQIDDIKAQLRYASFDLEVDPKKNGIGYSLNSIVPEGGKSVRSETIEVSMDTGYKVKINVNILEMEKPYIKNEKEYNYEIFFHFNTYKDKTRMKKLIWMNYLLPNGLIYSK